MTTPLPVAFSMQPRPRSKTGVHEKPSVHLAREHAEIREHLRHLRASLGELDGASVKERRRLMDHAISFLEEHVENHTRHEDRDLYPIIEQHLGSPWLTAALRVEHRVLLDTFDELRRTAAQPTPSEGAFVRLVDNLLGMLTAHFAAEEEVLFPAIDELTAANQPHR